MTQFGTQVQTKLHARFATAAALPTCTYSDAHGVLPTGTMGARLTASAVGALTVDGGTPVIDDVILVKDEVASLGNGPYIVANPGSATAKWQLRRHPQADESGQFEGMLVTTGPEGSTNASVTFLYSGVAAPVIGTDAITYATSLSSSGVVAALQTQVNNLFTAINIQSISTGGSTTMGVNTAINQYFAYISSGTLATYELIADDGTIDGQSLHLTFNHIITALTYTGANWGSAGLAVPTAAAANTQVIWVWDTTLKWVRVQ